MIADIGYKKIGEKRAISYALGCAVGWGAFVMPVNIFLPEAGPLGTVIGIAIATVIIMIIGLSLSYMSRRFPDARGVHVYIERVLGADHAFLASWALVLAYLSILWANATSTILLIRYLLGDTLQWGLHYRVADYDVYLGEMLVTALVLLIFGVLACFGKKAASWLHAAFAVIMVLGSAIVFTGVVIAGHPSMEGTFGFAESSGISPAAQIFNIAMLGPWMFVGFEAVTYVYGHDEESSGRMGKVLTIGIFLGFIIYALMSVVPVLALPGGYTTWMNYLENAKTSNGLMGLPIFYSVRVALGDWGFSLLVVTVISAIATTLFGLYRVTGRMLAIMAGDGIMPRQLAKINKNGEPQNAIFLVMAVSMIIPFFGRTAIGWIVDVTTISATIVYVYVSISAFRMTSLSHGTYGMRAVSLLGAALSLISFLFLMIPSIISENHLAKESYFILAIWSIVGLIYYWAVFRRDKKYVYGQSTVMWIMMLFLIFFSMVMWTQERAQERVAWEMGHFDHNVDEILQHNSIIEIGVVIIALAIMFNLFSTMIRRERELDKKAMESEARNVAKTTFLANMSHDIRTPMNAILGFTDLALLDTGNQEKMDEYLHKIKASGGHLLSLINDVLEMSRIESGKIELSPSAVNLTEVFNDLDSIMRGQAEAKEQMLSVDASGLRNKYVMVDRLRLNQVLLNLSSNAVKYTQEGGFVRIEVIQLPGGTDERADYELRVKDNGMGMSPEFAAKVFEAFERDKDAEMQGIQGTGLGMAITKRIVDMMGGTIRVETAPGEGSEFIVELSLPIASESDIEAASERNIDVTDVDFGGRRVLLTDDVDINREIAVAVLEMFGLDVEQAIDGQDAYEKVLTNPGGYYDVILMDIQMPRMNGYEAARAIRSIADEKKSRVPIIAMTANAFEEDKKNAKRAGMNSHVAKPIDQEKLAHELYKVLKVEG